jgi:transposase-like protein
MAAVLTDHAWTNKELIVNIHVSSVKPTIPLCISFYSHAGRVPH